MKWMVNMGFLVMAMILAFVGLLVNFAGMPDRK